jgi:uncharacterized protein
MAADGTFPLLIKPVSADCNLRCGYCFYLDHLSFYGDRAAHRMSDATLERLIAGYLATQQPVYSFIWQGGEPTLLGLDFWQRVTDLQQRHGRRGIVIANSLQTNATLITDDLARHLADYRFLVGVSLDGPADVHDAHRRSANAAGSHARVMRGIERLRKAGVEFNVLSVVSAANVNRASEVYRYLCGQDLLYQQYIPCVEFGPDGQLKPYSITGEQWGRFLCALFEEWDARDTYRVSIRSFDTIIRQLAYGQIADCQIAKECRSHSFVVEYNGDVFPCDFYVLRELRLGNIHHDTWDAIARSPTYDAFARRKLKLPEECISCRHLAFCHGGCPKHRTIVADSANLPTAGLHNTLCLGWRAFLDRCLPRLSQLAAEIRLATRAGAPDQLQ